MRLKESISSKRELKKMTYKLLKKMYGLERGKKSQLCSKTCRIDPCIVACIGHIRNLLAHALQNILQQSQSGSLSVKIRRYLASLDQLLQKVTAISSSNIRLEKGLISRLLRSHTKLFNAILSSENNLDVQFSPSEWSGAVLTAVAIWGNNISTY